MQNDTYLLYVLCERLTPNRGCVLPGTLANNESSSTAVDPVAVPVPTPKIPGTLSVSSAYQKPFVPQVHSSA